MLHIFTEEPSAKNVFDVILPQILPENVYFKIYSHQGKQDLERALKTTVPSISKIPGAKILITMDQDNHDCKVLKENLLGLIIDKCVCQYRIRIVCQELESWFLGDLRAIKLAYNRFNVSQYAEKSKFKNVDIIVKPNQYLLKIIPEYEKREKLPKLEVSERIAPYLDIQNNTSNSFCQTIAAIKTLIEP